MAFAQPAWEVPSLRRYTDVKTDHEGLRLLALQGCWREVLERLKEPNRPKDTSREEELALSTYHVLALVKLRQYTVASKVLEALGDLDSPQMQSRTAAGLVPFALRWLAAELPHRLGNSAASQDALYRLTQLCETEAVKAEEREAAAAAGGPRADGDAAAAASAEAPALGTASQFLDSSTGAPSSTWWRRYDAVGLAITNHHLRGKQHIPALQWLRRIERRKRGNPQLLSMVGYVQMMLGDLAAAEGTFSTVAKLGTSESEAVTHRNRSLLLFARRRYRESQEELEGFITTVPGDSVAVNNHAITQMYCCDLVGGIKAMEDSLRSRPMEHVSEPMMMTLTLMYELSLAGAAADAKRRVSQWIGAFAPDDFDMACMRGA